MAENRDWLASGGMLLLFQAKKYGLDRNPLRIWFKKAKYFKVTLTFVGMDFV